MLVGHRVILRTLREEDQAEIYDLAADVREMGPFYPARVLSEIQLMKGWRENGWWTEDGGGMLICAPEGPIVGQVTFHKAGYFDAYELGYRIYRSENFGKGYMSEAVGLFTAYLFASHTIARVQATVLPQNEGSRRVLEKNGFTREGRLRQVVLHHGQMHDLDLYSILRAEARPLFDLLKPL